MKRHTTVQFLSCSQGQSVTDTHTHTHARTKPQQRYYIPSATRCAGIIRKQRWLPSSPIGWNILDSSSSTAEQNLTKLERKQVLNILYLMFSGWFEYKDSLPGLRLAKTCLTSLQPLNRIWQNLTRNKCSDDSLISLIQTKSAGTDFRFWTDGRFSNPENSLIQKYRPRTNVSVLTNHHCTCPLPPLFSCTGTSTKVANRTHLYVIKSFETLVILNSICNTLLCSPHYVLSQGGNIKTPLSVKDMWQYISNETILWGLQGGFKFSDLLFTTY